MYLLWELALIAFGMAANIPGHSATEWGAVNVAFVCCVTECLWTYAYECVYLVFPVWNKTKSTTGNNKDSSKSAL